MATNPIKAQPKPGAAPDPTTQAAAPKNPTPPKVEPKETKPQAKPGLPKPNLKGPSPLQKQHRDMRGQPDYTPVTITFLTGVYKGQTIDLGLSINEISHSESAEWESQAGDSIRPGLNFKNLSNREISFTLTYFDLNLDSSHLVENLKHLKEVAGEEKAPPRLLLVQGDMRAVECVCTDIQDKYSDPLPGRKGMRKCEVSITFKLNGGLNNANALGGPLTSTPLQDYRATLTEKERQKLGRQRVASLLLAQCLGPEGSDQLERLINDNAQSDIQRIAQLDPNVFVQSAIAGVFTTEILASERLKAKLKQDLALVVAQNEPGISNTPEVRRFAEAMASGNPTGLTQRAQDQYGNVKPDYDKILKAVEAQKLDESAEIFDRNQNRTAAGRLYDSGTCGLDMRRLGAAKLSPTTQEDSKVLKEINTFFSGKPTDEQIKERFGLQTESQIRAVKNGQPYQTKDQFIAKSSNSSSGLTGYKLWSNFMEKVET